MLEQLGLGIILSMEDNFTEQSNTALQSFDRLQSGAEDMVKSISHKMMTLQNVMLAGFSLSEVGSGIENAGKKVLGTFKDLGNQLVQTNASFETLKAQLKTVFNGNEKDAENAFGWIRDFAIKTPFQVENTTQAMVGLKNVGIDIRDTFKDANGQAKPFLQYLGDLATLNMDSATGGIKGMMYAISNAVAGQWKSLQDRFNIPKEYIENLKKLSGKELEQGIVDLATKMTPNAMGNMVGTWSETLSEMQDTWHNFLYDIGQAGVFDTIKKTLLDLSMAMGRIMTPELAQSLRQVVTDIWRPIDAMAHGLITIVGWFGRLTESHPVLAKIALEFMAISGVVLTLTGFAMKLAGNLIILGVSVASLALNFQLLKLEGITVASMFSGITAGATALVSSLAMIGIAGAGLYFAWQDNFMGLRDTATGAFNNIVQGWQVATQALKDNGLAKAIMGDSRALEMKYNIKMPPLARMFGQKFLTIIAIGKAFWQVFTGVFDNGVMHFSKKDWDLYKAVGIEGFVQGLVYAKDKINAFFQGFKEGLELVGGLALQVVVKIQETIVYLIDVVDRYRQDHPHGLLAGLFFTKDGVDVETADALANSFKNLGRVVGGVVSSVLAFKGITKITSFITSPFKSLYKTLFKVGEEADIVKEKLVTMPSGTGTGLAGRHGGHKGATPMIPLPEKEPTLIQGARESFKTGGLSGAGLFLSNRLFGKQATGIGVDVAKHFKDNDKTTNGYIRRDGKFSTVGANNVNSTYYTHHLQQHLKDGEEVQVRNRSKLGKLFLGESYFAKGANGERRRLGHLGGILNLDRDDYNIRNMATSLFSKGIMARNSTSDKDKLNVDKSRYTNPVRIGDTVGKVNDLKFKNLDLLADHREAQNAVQSQIRDYYRQGKSNANLARDMALRKFDSDPTERWKSVRGEYNHLAGLEKEKRLSPQQASLLNNYRTAGFDGTRQGFKNMENSELGKILSSAHRLNYGNQAYRANMPQEPTQLLNQARQLSGNQDLFKDNRQSALSRGLFGQRYYTVTQDEKGNYRQNVVARKGGLLRRAENDLVFNDRTSTLRGIVRNSRPVQAVAGVRDRVVSGARAQVSRVTSAVGSRVSSSRVGRAGGAVASGVSRVARAVPRYASASLGNIMQYTSLGSMVRGASNLGRTMNARLQGAGFKGFTMPRAITRIASIPQTFREQGIRGGIRATAGSAVRGAGGAVRSTGRFLFGSSFTNSAGETVKRAGAVQRVGGIARRGAGLVGRGAGALGGLAMRALPVAMLGGMAFSGIKSLGAGKTADQKKQLGVKDNASDFQTGLAVAKKAVQGANFASMWKSFKTEAKDSFKIIADIAKSAWEKLKPMLPEIMQSAWEGIKAMAGIAWEWIKTDGVTLLGEVGQSAMQLLGVAWDWIKTTGAQKFGEFVGDALVWIAQLGAYIVTNIPNFLSEAVSLGGTVLGGLLDIGISIFSGLAGVVKNAFVGALQGLGNILAGALSSTIRAIPAVGDQVADFLGLPKHHGGLWMSGDEHPAIIRKDETVLPPDISKQLHRMLVVNKSSGGAGSKAVAQEKGSTPAQVHTGDSFNIDKIEIQVQANQLSRADAEKQANYIIDVLKKRAKGKRIRNFQDIDGSGDLVF